MLLKLKLLFTYFLSQKKQMVRFENSNKKIIIALAANYGNLGDVAITYAQKQFLQSKFPEYDVLEFEISNTFTSMKSLKSYVREDDIITIVGGGNFGDLYDDIEFARQFIIHNFPNNKIVIFPQTISFSKSPVGWIKKLWAKFIYNNHKNLTIFVREQISYKEYNKIFKKIKVAPDIVMSLNYEEPDGLKRNGVTICFRNDKENGVNLDSKYAIISEVKKIYKTQIRDTHIGKQNNLTKLYSELKKLIQVFQESKLVITDRLHGMILSYVTHTPCIAICGGNKKILGCYQWIKETNFIRLINYDVKIENVKELLCEIDKLYNMKEVDKKYINLTDKFDEIYKTLSERDSIK